MRRALAIVAVALLAACAPKPVGDAALERAKTFSAGVDSARLMADVDTLTSSHLSDEPLDCSGIDTTTGGPAIPLPYCNITRVKNREILRTRLEGLGFTFTTQDDDGPTFASSNLIAELRGTERPDEVVMLGAHYDAFYAGADDNTSGVAAMLELARLASGQRFARTIRLVFFDLEELGIVGSVRYVDSLAVAKDETRVVAVVFDCIAYRNPAPGSQRGVPGFPVPDTADFLAAIANDASRPQLEELLAVGNRLDSVPIRGVVAPGMGANPLTGQLTRSDHSPFWFKGERALFLSDTADLRNPNYHRASDLPETLDPGFFGGVTQLVAGALSVWAEGPLP